MDVLNGCYNVFVYNDLMYKGKMIKCIKDYGIIESRQAAMMPGKLYKCTRNLVAAVQPKRTGQYVYGFLYRIKGEPEVIRILDGYHGCSLSYTGLNSAQDLTHRTEVYVTDISFDSPETFLHGKFTVGTAVNAFAYFGNTSHYRMERSFRDIRNYIGSLTSDFFSAYYENNF